LYCLFIYIRQWHTFTTHVGGSQVKRFGDWQNIMTTLVCHWKPFFIFWRAERMRYVVEFYIMTLENIYFCPNIVTLENIYFCLTTEYINLWNIVDSQSEINKYQSFFMCCQVAHDISKWSQILYEKQNKIFLFVLFLLVWYFTYIFFSLRNITTHEKWLILVDFRLNCELTDCINFEGLNNFGLLEV
jgi:hypothetical protein